MFKYRNHKGGVLVSTSVSSSGSWWPRFSFPIQRVLASKLFNLVGSTRSVRVEYSVATAFVVDFEKSTKWSPNSELAFVCVLHEKKLINNQERRASSCATELDRHSQWRVAGKQADHSGLLTEHTYNPW